MISNWEGKVDQESETVGSLVEPVAPIRRIADITRSLIQTMHCARFGGAFAVAALVTRAGWKISERSVERIRAEAFIRPPSEMRDDIQPDAPPNPVITRFVHHTWMLDLSPFHTLGDGGDLWLGGVFDAHSRTPLILKTYPKRPGAAAMAKLFKTVVAKFQTPKYVITDLGVEFKGAFEKAVDRAGSKLRRCVKDLGGHLKSGH